MCQLQLKMPRENPRNLAIAMHPISRLVGSDHTDDVANASQPRDGTPTPPPLLVQTAAQNALRVSLLDDGRRELWSTVVPADAAGPTGVANSGEVGAYAPRLVTISPPTPIVARYVRVEMAWDAAAFEAHLAQTFAAATTHLPQAQPSGAALASSNHSTAAGASVVPSGAKRKELLRLLLPPGEKAAAKLTIQLQVHACPYVTMPRARNHGLTRACTCMYPPSRAGLFRRASHLASRRCLWAEQVLPAGLMARRLPRRVWADNAAAGRGLVGLRQVLRYLVAVSPWPVQGGGLRSAVCGFPAAIRRAHRAHPPSSLRAARGRL